MASLVSVIIPAKNRVNFVKEALLSVYKQKLPEKISLEVILIDDLSEPPLSSLLKKEFPKVKFVRNNTKKHGPGAARNIGLKKAKGKYIAFLDSDDQWKEEFLKRSIETLISSKAPAVCCFTSPYFFGKYSIKEIFKLIFLNCVRTFCMIFSWVFNNGNLPKDGFYLCQVSHMVFDKHQVKNIKFREDLAAAEDWDFIIKSTAKEKIKILPLPLVKFRYEMKSYTYSHSSKDAKWKAYGKMLEDIPNTHIKGVLYRLFLKYISLFS